MEAACKLILHVGFPKTGSSAIQAWLAKNAESLARHGIAYRGFREEAARDAITSGNGRLLADFLRAGPPASDRAFAEFTRRILPEYFADHRTAIVSNEGLAAVPPPQLEWLRAACERQGISVSVVAYIRSVYGHCYSDYQQRVKGKGESGTFREYAATYGNPQCKWSKSWRSVFGDALRLRNYDAARNELILDFARQAGIDHLELPVQQGVVNRSLSFGELEILRRLNGYHKGLLSRELSDALIYADPAAKPDYLFDEQVAEDFERRFSDDVQKINEIFFRDSPEKLVVVGRPEREMQRSESPELSWDPVVEAAFKALCEIAASAKERETRLRSQLSMALARLAIKSENWDAAERHLRSALRLNPDSEQVNRLLDQVASRQAKRTSAI